MPEMSEAAKAAIKNAFECASIKRIERNEIFDSVVEFGDDTVAKHAALIRAAFTLMDAKELVELLASKGV